MIVRYGQSTDAGVKERNEDSLGIRIPEDQATLLSRGVAAVIADGVSAAEAAREAADLCVLGFLNDYYSTPESWQVKTAAQRVLSALNRWLYSEGQRFRTAGKGFVCAMSAVVIKGNLAHVFHVGDTRVWHYRNGKLELVTRDHSQQINQKTAYLSRAMGLSLDLRIDYFVIHLRVGDALLLTTDGIHDNVSVSQLRDRIDTNEDPDRITEDFTRMALDQESQDNLSCQLVWIDALPAPDQVDQWHELNALPFPPDLDPGMRLDGWEVEELLDASPRSQIYRVTHVETGREAVMKTPSRNYEGDSAYIERFVREEWVGKRIDSPHLVSIVAKSRQPQFLYYLMEYVSGLTLGEWMKQNPKSEVSTVTNYVEQLIKGLRALHRKEILHQDLKPDNIIVESDGNLKIIDFGSVRVAGMEEIEVPFTRGGNLGTARYGAPEYRLGQRASTRSDQFSLAVIAYELLTGHHPYGDGYEAAQTPTKFARLVYTPAIKHNPMVPVWIDRALEKALRLEPSRRYEALSEFNGDLLRPNPDFVTEARHLPLIEQNPVRFWKIIAFLLGLGWMLTLFFF